MTDREKITEILSNMLFSTEVNGEKYNLQYANIEELADYLIAHGITVKKENPAASRDSISVAFLHHITALTDGMTHYERLENDIKICSGYSLEELRDMFAAGFTLIKTEDDNSMKKIKGVIK